jgi:hypothetical protein
VIFIEFKRRGKKATTKQLEEHEAMRAAGLTVLVFDNRDDCIAYLQSIEDEEKW